MANRLSNGVVVILNCHSNDTISLTSMTYSSKKLREKNESLIFSEDDKFHEAVVGSFSLPGTRMTITHMWLLWFLGQGSEYDMHQILESGQYGAMCN